MVVRRQSFKLLVQTLTPQELKERMGKGSCQPRVIMILYGHIEWINSLFTCGHDPIVDMPLDIMKNKCDKIVIEISKIASCQFGQFRLGIMTTILSGCGLLKEGKHLRNLMYPVKGSASFKHLCCPVADSMSPKRAQDLCNIDKEVSVSNVNPAPV